MSTADTGSSPTSGPELPGKGRAWIIGGGISGGVFLIAIIIAISVIVDRRVFTPTSSESPPAQGEGGLPRQTEAIFQSGLDKSNDTEEWMKARADHQRVAYAVFYCKKLSDVPIDLIPREMFSALLLDLTPSGNHVFNVKDGDGRAMLDRAKNVKPILITSADHELLSLSDSIARSRLAASTGANKNAPVAYHLGLITLFVTALGTLFITLQGKMERIDEPPNYKGLGIWRRLGHKLFGLGSGFRWVAFLAISLSIAGTSLTGLRQIFDPTRTLTQNTRAVLELRQFHLDLTGGIQCGSDGGISSNSKKWQQWADAVRRIRGSIIPDFGAYANLDLGGVAQTDLGPENGIDKPPSDATPTAQPAQGTPTSATPP
jgi:hypothetical protein